MSKRNYTPKPKPEIPDLPGEEWDNMIGSPNYLVSTMGRVKNIRRGTLKKPCDDGAGYDIITPFYNGKRQVRRLARVIWETFNNCECKQTIDHINREKKDNRLENLRCISHKEQYENKTFVPNNTNKYGFTEEDKGEIAKALRDDTKTTWQLMKEYKAPTKYFRTIRQRGSWLKYIQEDGI